MGVNLFSNSQLAMDFKVMTWNIRYGTADDGPDKWENRKEGVFELIRKQDADVVGLQEALDFQLDEILKACPDYGSFGVGRDDGVRKGEFSAILYKKDRFKVVEGGTKWISEQPDKFGSIGPGATLPRIFTWCQLKHQSGCQLWVVNTHLDHESDMAQSLGAEQILNFLATTGAGKSSTLVMGDFNCGSDNEPVKRFLEAKYRDLRPETGPYGTFSGFKVGTTDGPSIDHLLVSEWMGGSAGEIVRTTYKGRYPSDHFPVVAMVSVVF